MSSYHIYGIGNAIVDYEVNVTESDLEYLGIEKGVMTLIELDDLKRYRDYFEGRLRERSGGGSAANTLLGAAQLGSRCFYGCNVAKDEPGTFYVDDLKSNGVVVGEVGSSEDMTGHCFVMITEDAERTMATYLGVSSSFSRHNLDLTVLESSDLLYIEGYLVASETGRQASIEAREHADRFGIKTALTLSDPNMVTFFKDELMCILGEYLHIIFSNREEALQFTDSLTVEDAAKALKLKSSIVVITLGVEGVLILSDDGFIKVKGRIVDAVDTNGAGDSFAGAFLAAYLQGKSLKEAGECGVIASSELVTQYGARLSDTTLSRVKDLISDIQVEQ